MSVTRKRLGPPYLLLEDRCLCRPVERVVPRSTRELVGSGKAEELDTCSTAEQLVSAFVAGELVRERRSEQVLDVPQLVPAGPHR